MNLCPCGGRGDPAADCACSPQRISALSREGLAGAARPVRPGRRDAPATGRGARCAARRGVRRGPRARDRRARAAARRRRPPPHRGGVGAARPRSRAGAALRPRPGACGTGGPHVAALAGADAVLPEHLAEALSYRSPVGVAGAHERSRHQASAPRSYPPLLRCDPRPAAAALAPGRGADRAARPACGCDRRRPRVLVLRPRGGSVAGPRARRGRPRRRKRHGPWNRRRGPPGRARRRRGHGRGARLRHRPRLPGGASRPGGPHRRERADRLRIRAGRRAAPWRFPARNRIIAGLCAATVVVEARERSGALITADFALEDGREVMVVPGEITSAVSAGSNALLRLGATPVTAAADVLEAYGIEPAAEPSRSRGPRRRPAPPAGRGRRRASTSWPGLGVAPGEVAAALIELELAGRVDESTASIG